MRTDPQVNFRIEQDLLDRLKLSAENSGRSITAELSYHLEKSVPVDPVKAVQFKLRIPGELHFKLQVASAESGLSMTAEAISRLESSFPIPDRKR